MSAVWTGGLTSGCVTRQACEQLFRWVDGLSVEQACGRTDEWAREQVDGRRPDRLTGWMADGQVGELIEGKIVGRVDSRASRWISDNMVSS